MKKHRATCVHMFYGRRCLPFDFQRSRGVASRGGKTADCPSTRDLTDDAVATRFVSGRA